MYPAETDSERERRHEREPETVREAGGDSERQRQKNSVRQKRCVRGDSSDGTTDIQRKRQRQRDSMCA